MSEAMIGGCVLLGFLNGMFVGFTLASLRSANVTINNSLSLDPYEDDDTDLVDDDDEGEAWKRSVN